MESFSSLGYYTYFPPLTTRKLVKRSHDLQLIIRLNVNIRTLLAALYRWHSLTYKITDLITLRLHFVITLHSIAKKHVNTFVIQ
jgi:hypothetical protein